MSALRQSGIALLGLTVVLATCDSQREPADPRPQFLNTGTDAGRPPSLEGVTHILVSLPPGDALLGPPWSITEPDAIRDVVAFLEKRDSSWQSFETRGRAAFLGPIVYADLYRGTGRLATLTYRGPIELGLEAKYANLYQTLSLPAVDTLVTLLRIPIRIVPVPPRDTEAAPSDVDRQQQRRRTNRST
jgi:hypothetical protein